MCQKTTTSNQFFADGSDFVMLLECLLKPCFGPDGMGILFEGLDGHTSCVHTGSLLVASLNPTNSAGILVIQAVKQLHNAIGDGSKKLILMAAAALRELALHCGPSELRAVGKGQVLAKVSSNLMDSLIPSLTTSQAWAFRYEEEGRLRHGVYSEQGEVVEEEGKVMEEEEEEEEEEMELQHHGVCFRLYPNHQGRNILEKMCQCLAETCIGNRLSANLKDKMIQMVTSLVFPPPQLCPTVQSLKKNVRSTLRNFDEVITHLSGVPPSESRVLPGFIIEREFVVEPRLPLKDFGVVLLLSGFDLDEDSNNNSVFNIHRVDSKSHLSGVVEGLVRIKEKIARNIASCGIRLILSACKIDQDTVHFMRLHSIGLIQMVPEETLCYIGESCGTHPFPSALDLLHLEESSWIKGEQCSYEIIGHHRIINLQCQHNIPPPFSLPPPSSSLPPPPSSSCLSSPSGIALCGGTIGKTRELSRIMHQVLKIIDSWCHELHELRETSRQLCFNLEFTEDEDGCLLALRGGGTWEIEVTRKLERDCLSSNYLRGSIEWIVCKSLQQAFLSVPLSLLKNTSSAGKEKMKIVDMVLGNAAMNEEDVPLGVDTNEGCLRCVDVSKSPLSSPWETHFSQVLLVTSVCDLLNKLLSIDGTLRTIASLKQDSQESDED